MQRVATIAGILDQHVGDAAFLWLQRAREVDGRHFGEVVFGRLDQRLTANLRGLAAAGVGGWAAALAQFADYPEPGEMFVIGVLALLSEEAAAVDKALAPGGRGGTGCAGRPIGSRCPNASAKPAPLRHQLAGGGRSAAALASSLRAVAP